MNLKETIRTEVRIQLSKLETTCHNMASLLHSLGILVGGWPNPLPKEVGYTYRFKFFSFSDYSLFMLLYYVLSF